MISEVFKHRAMSKYKARGQCLRRFQACLFLVRMGRASVNAESLTTELYGKKKEGCLKTGRVELSPMTMDLSKMTGQSVRKRAGSCLRLMTNLPMDLQLHISELIYDVSRSDEVEICGEDGETSQIKTGTYEFIFKGCWSEDTKMTWRLSENKDGNIMIHRVYNHPDDLNSIDMFANADGTPVYIVGKSLFVNFCMEEADPFGFGLLVKITTNRDGQLVWGDIQADTHIFVYPDIYFSHSLVVHEARMSGHIAPAHADGGQRCLTACGVSTRHAVMQDYCERWSSTDEMKRIVEECDDVYGFMDTLEEEYYEWRDWHEDPADLYQCETEERYAHKSTRRFS